jgi:hypothetical protein
VTAERYVDAVELAEIMGVSVRTVRRMVTEGLPSETWGMARTRRFLPSAALDWAHRRATIQGDPNGTPMPSRENSTFGK